MSAKLSEIRADDAKNKGVDAGQERYKALINLGSGKPVKPLSKQGVAQTVEDKEYDEEVELFAMPVQKPKRAKRTTTASSTVQVSDLSMPSEPQSFDLFVSSSSFKQLKQQGNDKIYSRDDSSLLHASQIEATGYSFRNSLRRKLVDLICSRSQSSEIKNLLSQPEHAILTDIKLLIDRALRLENKLFSLHQCTREYHFKSRSLIFNLSDPKNPEPLLGLITGSISPEDFCTIDLR